MADVISDMWKREEDKLKVDKDAKRIFLKNEKAYKIGEIHKQEQLSETLEYIAKMAGMAFMMDMLPKI